MSSQSTLTPPSNDECGHKSAAPLSNDALYAPLSTYADCSSTCDDGGDAVTTPRKSAHSLALQTASSLRESSLVTFLTSMSRNLKTSHSHEYQLYRGLGGSIARFGVGDTDRASNSTRNVLETKLLNRSLVLVGGGVYSHAVSKKTVKINEDVKSVGVVGLRMGHVAPSSQRERKRAGGNGTFGCISKKKRERILCRIIDSRPENGGTSNLPLVGGYAANDASSPQQKPPQNEKLGRRKELQGDGTATDNKEKGCAVIDTLHRMWVDYMHQLLSTIKESNAKIPPTFGPPFLLTLEDRKRLSLLLATAEHVGMPTTIVECPSRHHLVNCQCTVVDETRGTWQVATIVTTNRKVAAKNNDTRPNKKSEMLDCCGPQNNAMSTSTLPPSCSWKIVMVPKHGTVLEVNLPWDGNPSQQKKAEVGFVTVRLETS